MMNVHRSRMNGHRSDYQRFLNGIFFLSDDSVLYRLLKSHGAAIFKFHILEVLATEGFTYRTTVANWKLILTLRSVIAYEN